MKYYKNRTLIKMSTNTVKRKAPDQENPNFLSFIGRIVIVLSSVLIIFAAARNSVTWHLQHFWGLSGNFWQTQWDKILDTIGEEPIIIWGYAPMILTAVVYWVAAAIYTIIDVTNKPGFLMRYKIQPGINEPVEKTKLLKVIGLVLMNQTIVTWPYVYVNSWLMQWRGYPSIRELPSFHWVLMEVAVFIVVQEIGVYYIHRGLHYKGLYKYIHKKHHEWTAPIAITAIYAHPIEHIVHNLGIPVMGVLLMGSHPATAWLWYCMMIFSAIHQHCGYHLPFFPSPEAHDFHHLKFNQNYGFVGWLDWLHGTDKKFRESPAYARHVMLLSFVPLREKFPDLEPNVKIIKKS